MASKTELANKYNEIFESNKTYAQLSEYDKLYALLALNSAGSGVTDTVSANQRGVTITITNYAQITNLSSTGVIINSVNSINYPTGSKGYPVKFLSIAELL